MIVVSDTSVISALAKIGRLDILKAVFNRVIIPPNVHSELLKLAQFGINIHHILGSNTWISVGKACNLQSVQNLRLDAGELEAIALVLELNADYLLIDERKGRVAATNLGIKIIGLLGILVFAKKIKYLTEVKPIMDKLINVAKFRISQKIYHQILQSVGE